MADQLTTKQLTLILLEELNEILSEGELEDNEYLDSIIYQCKILINYTHE